MFLKSLYRFTKINNLFDLFGFGSTNKWVRLGLRLDVTPISKPDLTRTISPFIKLSAHSG